MEQRDKSVNFSYYILGKSSISRNVSVNLFTETCIWILRHRVKFKKSDLIYKYKLKLNISNLNYLMFNFIWFKYNPNISKKWNKIKYF